MEVLRRLPVRSASSRASHALLPVLEITGAADFQKKPRGKSSLPSLNVVCRPACSPVSQVPSRSASEARYMRWASKSALAGSRGAGFGDLMEIRRHAAKGVRFSSTRPQAVADSPPTDQVGTTEKVEKVDEPEDDRWQVKMLYDGECPLCMMEVNMLRERNQSYGAIKFVDIAAPDYSAAENQGVNFETAMGKIHAIQRDGTILTNVAAFRRFYEVLGMGWVYAITKYEPLSSVADAVYSVWAKYRLPITGRPSLAVVLEERRRRKVEGANCDLNGRCQSD